MSTQSAALKTSERLSPSILTPEQQKAITALYEGNRLLVGNMGAGKSIVAATAIAELLEHQAVSRVLIVTTPKIANTVWAQEFDTWAHTHHVPVGIATGIPEEREQICKNPNYEVVVVTFNVLPWMKENKLFDLFDGLLIDETTKLKTTGGAQFKALRPSLKKFKWRGGLTGTPVSEDFLGLYGQIMLIDAGYTLGTRKDAFMSHYFYPTDFKQYNWALKEGAAEELLKAIKPLVHVIPDYRHELPPIVYETVALQMPEDLMAYYDEMRKDMVTEDASSASAATLVLKLQQIASGFIYGDDGEPVRLSTFRLQGLLDTLKRINSNVIISYWFQEDLAGLREWLPDAEELNPKNLKTQVKRWNAGEIKTLLIHPRSAGHGLQLEKGGHTIIWYAPQWSRDLYEQTNARIWRRGQTEEVKVITLVASDTVDLAVQARVWDKAEFERLFMKHMKGEDK